MQLLFPDGSSGTSPGATPPAPTLYLIDGYAQFFRCYHAIRTPMTSPVTKEPTNMTFGFVGMLLKILRAEGPAMRAWGGRPTYLAVALDVGGDRGTFRTQLYPEYKATRKPPPEDLEPQVQRCLALLRAVGVPIIGSEGFEADDVFATLVGQLRATHPTLCIRMVSKDKDLKQLLTPEDAGDGRRGVVELFDVHTDGAFNATTLRQETGLRPDQVVDMLTLMGDTSDNVPGVEGVGDKTAAQLIAEHGTLDALVQHVGMIKGKRGEKLREAIPHLTLSKQLITLRSDVPVALDIEAARTDRLELAKLIPICKELGFNRYQDDVRSLLGVTGTQTPEGGSGVMTQMPVSLFNTTDAITTRSIAPTRAASTSASERIPSLAHGTASSANAVLPGGLFSSLAARATLRTAQSGTYRCITSIPELKALAADMAAAPIIAIDTETTSLSPRDAKLCGVSVAIEPGSGFYIPTRSPTPDKHLTQEQVLDELRPILQDPRLPKCGHNLKYDMLIFRAHGVRLTGLSQAPTSDGGVTSFDSMIASYLIDASRSSHSLDALALALLNRTNISLHELLGSGKQMRTFDTLDLEQATQYAAEDADVAMQLRAIMLPQLRAMNLISLFADVEMPLVEVLAELEWNGIAVDASELDRQRKRLQSQIEDLLEKIRSEAKASVGRTFDPDSPKQLAAVLFNKPDDLDAPGGPGLGIKSAKKTKTGYSTDAEVLETLANDESIATPIPALILEYRQLTKLVSTYLVALKDAIHPQTGRIHSSFHQTVAATGRLASSDPNLQNIPIRTDVGRDVRKAFVAPQGHVLVTADYSQIELRLLAHLSRDPALIDAFHHDADIHTAVAAQIAGKLPSQVTREERSGAKMVNFGIVYGITPFGLARRLKIDERSAGEIITNYKRRFAGITTFLQECVEQARTQGSVTTILGRKRPIPDIDSTNASRRALAERLAINSVVQGSAADLIKLAMVNIYRAMQHPSAAWPACLMLLQIHDELVFECAVEHAPEVRQLVVQQMEGAMSLSVPLKADAHTGRTWFEGK